MATTGVEEHGRSVSLPQRLLNPLHQIAVRRGLSLETMIEALLTDYLRNLRHTQLLAEMERYRARHVELKTAYSGEYIGLYEGRVLDHDLEGGDLYARLRREHGDLPILIVQVTGNPEQEFTLRNPSLESNE
ncbi:MAG: hypothetical protein AAB427_05485 [Chloroflexota bacterium]